MKADRDTFGPQLRLERERRGITLRKIAESTKLKESLFAELERGDFSKWPQGIFRRAHLCAYVSAIGLPSQPVLAEFLRLFPSDDAPNESEHTKPHDRVEEVRAGLPVGTEPMAIRRSAGSRLTHRMWVAVFDLAAICLISSIFAGIVGVGLWVAATFVAVGYSGLGIGCFGKSVGAYVQQRIRGGMTRPSAPQPAAAPVPEVRLIVSRPERADRPSSAAHDTHHELDVEEQRRASA
jgi:transcriptional regulator with XRE-family HTH domain